MFKITKTYKDFDGNDRTEDFYFNLTEAECLKIQAASEGGLKKVVEKIIQEKDQARIVAIFEDIVLKAYGEKSLDGRRFMKTPEITEAFSQTQAYSDIFMELAYDAEKAAAFVNGIVPNKE